MIILVDYDNIESNLTRLGIQYTATKIVSKINPNEVTSGNHILIRLYGGWYEISRFTHKAQNLSSDISAIFPMVLTLSDNNTTVIVNCEMAYSLLADPTNHLLYTFRPRGMPEGLKARPPIRCGCTDPTCPLIAVYDFINNDGCSKCNIIKPKDIFYRGEQKLVDTMLTSDLIYLSNQPNNLCIVSSDDDFWPGIITTLMYGKKIIHLHTRTRTTPTHYSRNAGTNYIQKNL